MKINEIEPHVYREIAETYNINEEQLDEVIPAIAAIAGGVARAALGGVAKSVGRAALGGAARSIGRAALGGAAKAALGGGAGGSMSSSRSAASTRRSSASYGKTNNPNATIGSQDDVDDSDNTQSTSPSKPNIQQKPTRSKMAAGRMIKLPTQTALGKIGPPKNFKVKQVKGDEVEIINPMPKPGEPKRFVFNKNELGSIIDET